MLITTQLCIGCSILDTDKKGSSPETTPEERDAFGSARLPEAVEEQPATETAKLAPGKRDATLKTVDEVVTKSGLEKKQRAEELERLRREEAPAVAGIPAKEKAKRERTTKRPSAVSRGV